MINVEKRKDIARLCEYYQDDFGAPAWDALGSDSAREARISKAVVSCDRSKVEWEPLPQRIFHGWMKALPSHVLPGSVIAIEVVCSPPKDFSVAALSGPKPRLRPEFLAIQDLATTLVALEIIRNCWVRRTAGNVLKFVSAIPQVWRFSHPFNRAGEPQLHDHLVVLTRSIQRGRVTASLDCRPFYALKTALEVLYHHVLVSGLKELGFEVLPTGKGIKSWGIGGIDPSILKDFSSRSRSELTLPPGMTRGEFARLRRLGMLSERGRLPKLPGASLAAAQQKWAEVIGTRNCEPSRFAREPLEPYEVKDCFQGAVILTHTELLAGLVSKDFGRGYPLQMLRESLDQYLQSGCESGDIVHVDESVYCHLGHLDRYRKLWTAVRLGLGQGTAGKLKISERASNWKDLDRLKAAVASPDLIRIVAVKAFPELEGGSGFLSVQDFEVSVGVSLLWEPQPTPAKLLSYIEARKATQKLVIVVPWEGGSRRFLGQLLKLGDVPTREKLAAQRVLKWGQVSFEVRQGTFEPDPLFAVMKKFPAGKTCVLAPPDMSPESFMKLTKELLYEEWRRLGSPDAHRIPIDEVIPWERAQSVGSSQAWLVPMRNLSGVARHGHRWKVAAMRGDVVVLRRGRTTKEVSLETLLKHTHNALLVRECYISMPVGTACVATASFRTKAGKLAKGRIVTPRAVEQDGSVILTDGGRFAPGFRLFTPALLMRMLPKGGGLRIVAEARDSVVQKLVEAKVRGNVILLAEDLEQAKLELAGTILGFQKIKKKEVEPEPFIPMGKGVFWPSMSYWWKQLAMWRERSRPGPDSPKKPTSISLGVSAEVLSGEALPEVREGQKMVCGPIQAAPVVAEPASEKPVVKSDAGGATAKAAKVSKEKRVRGKRVELPPAPSLPGTIG